METIPISVAGGTMDEGQLISAARLGDGDAFRELYALHAGAVRAMARPILRTNDTEDICQDTFLLAFTRLDSFEGNAAFGSWITRIAINQCLVSLRKRRQASKGDWQVLSLDTEDWLERSVFSSADRELEGVPARLDVNKLLRILPPLQRRVVEMAYLEGIPDLEIAEIIGATPNAVSVKLHQAKRRMRLFSERSCRE
jgi:RNA polymerase sigma-70 factor, ECF subfamily